MKKKILLAYLFLILLSCKHDLEGPSWNNEMIFPIVNTKMTINNIASDSNINITENNNGFLNLIYSENFLTFELDTLVKIDAIADEQIHTLDSVSFDDVIISDTSTIGNVITEIPFGTILFPDGIINNIPSIPNIANGDTIDVDASKYFETMTLFRGMLSISLYNGYPTDISNVSLTLINSENQNIVATFFFPLIQSGTSISDSVSIAGQTIDENLFAILNNLDINSSNGPVLIDYSDAIITNIKISNIGITEATAIFPEQQLTETLKEHTFDLGSAELKEIGIKKGTVTVNVLSTLPNGKMVYNIPSLKKNGVSFTSGEMIVPQATNTELTSFSFNFDGYILDLTGKKDRIGGDTVNTIYTESYTYIDSTGTLEYINNTDSFYSFVEYDLVTEYALGYLGQDTLEILSKEKTIDIFNNINASRLEVEQVDLKIKINNYIGADLNLKIIELNGENNLTNEEINLINNETIEITRANLSNNSLPINLSTSEITVAAEDFINVIPNKIFYSANIYTNPNGPSNTNDFLYPEYPIEARMSLNIPLRFIAENFSFIDTFDIKLPNNQNNINIEKIYVEIINDFPFDTDIQIILTDENNLVLDTIIKNFEINSAQIDNNGIINSSSSVYELEYSNLENGDKIIVRSNFNTNPINEFINIYSHYELKINLSAKINRLIGKWLKK